MRSPPLPSSQPQKPKRARKATAFQSSLLSGAPNNEHGAGERKDGHSCVYAALSGMQEDNAWYQERPPEPNGHFKFVKSIVASNALQFIRPINSNMCQLESPSGQERSKVARNHPRDWAPVHVTSHLWQKVIAPSDLFLLSRSVDPNSLQKPARPSAKWAS